MRILWLTIQEDKRTKLIIHSKRYLIIIHANS